MKKILTLVLAIVSIVNLSAQLDAAFPLSNDLVVLVKGDRVVIYNITIDKVENNSLLSQGALTGVSFSKIDAALNFGNGKIYIFSGEDYVRFDIASFAADEGYPKKTSDYWPGVNYVTIDAAMNWPNKSYFFTGGKYSRYLTSENKVSEGYPKAITSKTWPGLPFVKIDAAFSIKGKTYFFSGTEYARYDIATDAMDYGYPKNISDWSNISKAFNPKKSMKAVLPAKPAKMKESSVTLALGDKRVSYSNRSDVVYDSEDKPVLIYSFEKDGSYIQPLDNYWVSKSDVIFIKDVYFYDLQIVDGFYYVLGKELGGYSGEGRLDHEEEGHVLLLLKVDKAGNMIFKKKLMGHEGVKGGSYFLCTMSSNGCLAYDGQNFHVFIETCGNFTPKGSSAFDLHEGDYYIYANKEGQVIDKSIWMHSHSGLLKLISSDVGEALSLSVGDAHPYGVSFNRFSNGKNEIDKVLFPDQDKLPYKDMYKVSKSSTEAGHVSDLVEIGDYIYTVIATLPVEKHPVLDQKKDLMFLKFDRNGNVLKSKWLGVTNTIDEDVPFISVYGDKIFLAYMLKTDSYDYDYKATIAVINTEGDYVVKPKSTEYYLDYQSRIINFPNGDVGLVCAEPYASEVTVSRFGETLLPSRADNVDQMSSTPDGINSSVKPLMPEVATNGAISIDLTKTAEENLRFDGSYKSRNVANSSKGIYCDGVYESSPDFQIYLNEFDYSNFTISSDFMVDEYRRGVVFSLSRNSRMITYALGEDGYLILKINNGTTRLESEVKYELNKWQKAKIKVVGNKITMYLDDKLVVSSITAITGASGNTADVSTTDFGDASTFKGYLRSFEVGKAQE